MCTKCRETKTASLSFYRHKKTKDGLFGWCKQCSIAYLRRPRAIEVAKKYRKSMRIAALIRYGGETPVCACCGESVIEFLGIDHINGQGTVHRKQMRKEGLSPYLWLRKHGYPSGFRVLCHNCNMAKGFYGACPHELMRHEQQKVKL